MSAVKLLSGCSNVKNFQDLLHHIDAVLEVLRDDVQAIVFAKKLYFSDFDFFYSTSCELVRKQVEKTHLRSIKNLYRLCLEDAIKWLIARIINNMRNISTNDNYRLYAAPKFIEFNEKLQTNLDTGDDIDQELENLSKKDLIDGIMKMRYSTHLGDFDDDELHYLCEKFEINVSNFKQSSCQIKKIIEKTESGNSQLVISF